MSRLRTSCLFCKYSLLQHHLVLTYQVYVVTGDRRDAGTSADIKLTLFGEHGSSGERPLLKSMNHSRKFQEGQVHVAVLYFLTRVLLWHDLLFSCSFIG